MHGHRRATLENIAKAAYGIYEAQSLPGANSAVIVSSSRKTFSCKVCGLENQPWHGITDHIRSPAHMAMQRQAEREAADPANQQQEAQSAAAAAATNPFFWCEHLGAPGYFECALCGGWHQAGHVEEQGHLEKVARWGASLDRFVRALTEMIVSMQPMLKMEA